MGYRNLQETVADLERTGQLRRLEVEVDPHLEVGAIQRRVYRDGGPALLFTRVKGTPFPLLGNLFGTLERARYLFRDTLTAIRDPGRCQGRSGGAAAPAGEGPRAGPPSLASAPAAGVRGSAAPAHHHVGGPAAAGFLAAGRRCLHHPAAGLQREPGPTGLAPTPTSACTGCSSPATAMRRDGEVGLHYQIHRGIGVHHAEAIARRRAAAGQCLRRRPAEPDRGRGHAAAGRDAGTGLCRPARRPSPGHGPPLPNGLPVPAEADFCLVGTIDPPRTLPEGPFGDHLGYYSLAHDFPVHDRSSGSTTARAPSGPSPPSAGRRRRTPPSAPSSTN